MEVPGTRRTLAVGDDQYLKFMYPSVGRGPVYSAVMARVQSERFQLAMAEMPCWKCQHVTVVAAVVAPSDSQVWEDDVEDGQPQHAQHAVMLSYVTDTSAELEGALRGAVPAFRPDFSVTVAEKYWMNHCVQCDAFIGDWYTQIEADGPFFAWSRAESEIAYLELVGGYVMCSEPMLEP
jgi:hypothetical protein